MNADDESPLTLIGHPWASVGMGAQLRSHAHALQSVSHAFNVMDIFRYADCADFGHDALLAQHEIDRPPAGIRLFHINADEIEPALKAFKARGGTFKDGHNIIMPAWELPHFPAQWVADLQRFDDVWAMSRFVQSAIAEAGIKSHLIAPAVEATPGPSLPRRHFGIRESAFVLLTLFDLSSYARRKNPHAALALFDRLRVAHPFADLQLVLKVKDGERDAAAWAQQHAADRNILILDQPLDSLGMRSLMQACDCFVSLHRAEGFGRGLGEAMALGRLALGTNWSGNTDFLTDACGLPVRCHLAALQDGDYPHWQGQHWAEPDVAHAAALLTPFLLDPSRGRALALRGQAEILRTHGNRAVGLQMLDQIEQICQRQKSPGKPR